MSREVEHVYKAIGIWSWPKAEDLAAFEQHYDAVHYPLAEKLPGVNRITLMTNGEAGRETRDLPDRRGVLGRPRGIRAGVRVGGVAGDGGGCHAD